VLFRPLGLAALASTLLVGAAACRRSSGEAGPVEASAPDLVMLHFISFPGGADVIRLSDGAKLGVTPLVQMVPRGEVKLKFNVKLAGYEDYPVTMDGNINETMSFGLTPVGQTPAPTPKPPDPQSL
jgi:hypothetical protein